MENCNKPFLWLKIPWQYSMKKILQSMCINIAFNNNKSFRNSTAFHPCARIRPLQYFPKHRVQQNYTVHWTCLKITCTILLTKKIYMTALCFKIGARADTRIPTRWVVWLCMGGYAVPCLNAYLVTVQCDKTWRQFPKILNVHWIGEILFKCKNSVLTYLWHHS